MSSDSSKKKPSPKSGRSSGDVDATSDKLQSVLKFAEDKPDTKPNYVDSPSSTLHRGLSSAAATTTSSSSSSSGSVYGVGPSSRGFTATARDSEVLAAWRNTQSGELAGPSRGGATGAGSQSSKTTLHRRSDSGPTTYSAGGRSRGTAGSSSSAGSRGTNVLSFGNICPLGNVSEMMPKAAEPKKTALRDDRQWDYGHGSITSSRGWRRTSGEGSSGAATTSMEAEEATRAGYDHYEKGNFSKAVELFTEALSKCPDNAAYLTNRAAALMELQLCARALADCEKALLLDPGYFPAHLRLLSINLRLGWLETVKNRLLTGPKPDNGEWQKIQKVIKHLEKFKTDRINGDWKNALREVDAAIVSGADSSLLLYAARAEALFRIHRLDDADSTLKSSSNFESPCPSSSQFFGMLSNSYFYVVEAQVDLALGRFDNAKLVAEKAREMDPRNSVVRAVLRKVKLVAIARDQGNESFEKGDFAKACSAYCEGLECDPSNPILLCNRAACWSKLEQWEKSIEDCNEALKIRPNYHKALLRRAESYLKLRRWDEAVQDYNILKREFPSNTNVAKGFFQAQLGLKSSHGEDVSNMKFGGQVKEVTRCQQLREAISIPGASIVYFMMPSDKQCHNLSPFVDDLCTKYPSLNFLKVNIARSPLIAESEKVKIVPAFLIYKNGERTELMICPSQRNLEITLRNLSSQ